MQSSTSTSPLSQRYFISGWEGSIWINYRTCTEALLKLIEEDEAARKVKEALSRKRTRGKRGGRRSRNRAVYHDVLCLGPLPYRGRRS